MTDDPVDGPLPYTVQFPGPDGSRSADLEHGAPLPRVGDIVEYLDERGGSRRFRVREVIHTLQSTAHTRPSVEEQPAAPHAFGRPAADEAEDPGASGIVRAGLPRVVLEEIES